MNNAISRLIESATADATEHAGKPWWEELSPEKQEQYLRDHPGSSKEEKQSTDVVPHGKKGNDAESGKPAKNTSTDVVKYSEKPVSDTGKTPPQLNKKPGTDVVPKGRRNDDITDVDFKETPRGEKKESPKLNSPEKKSTEEAPKSNAPKQLKGPEKKTDVARGPKKDWVPDWGVDSKEAPQKESPSGEKKFPQLNGPKKFPQLEGPKSEPKSDSNPASEKKEAPKLEHQPDKEYKVNEPAPKKPSGDSQKAPPKSAEKPKAKEPEKKAEPAKPAPKSEPKSEPKSAPKSEPKSEPKSAPKSEPKSEPKKPSAVDRIQEDEAEEKSAKDRANEKHDLQMEIIRNKERDRQADRAEKKAKEEKKAAEDKAAKEAKELADKEAKDAKDAEKKPEEKKPEPKKDEKKSDKKDEKKSDKKVEKKDEKKHSKPNTDKRPNEKPGSPGSRSDPAAEQHKPNSMPNNEGGPNPHGGDSDAGGAVKRLQENGGDFSPVPPSGKPTSPAKPISPKAPPGEPDDNDVTFEDEPNTSKGPESQSNQESEQPSSGPNSFESEQPGGSAADPGLGGENPSSMSESPNVEEKPGNMSEGVDVDQTPSGEAIPFEQQDETPSEPVAPEAGPDHDANPGESLESPEQAPSETSEPAPEGESQPTPEAPKFGEQNEPTAPAPAFENKEPSVEAPTPMQPQQDNIPDATPNVPEPHEAPQSPESEKEDMGQSAPGFGGGAPGAIPLGKEGGGIAPGGPKSDGGGGMPGQSSQPSMRDERGQPAQPYQIKPPGAAPDKGISKPGAQQPQGQQQQPGGGVPTKPNSPARTQSADVIRNQAPNIAQRLMQDGEGVPKGLAAMYNILEGRGTAQDGHAAVSLLSSILDNAAAAASTGAGGPLGFATLMAIKHAGVPAMVAIVKKAFGGGMPTVNPEHQQEELTRLVQSAADYAQAGNIPAEAWHKGVQEAKQQAG